MSKDFGRFIKPVLALMVCGPIIFVATGARAVDDEDRSVLGGSPPIYVGPLVIGTIQTYRSKRYFSKDRPAEPPGLQLGNRCATKIGISGPGPKLPLGEVCVGMDANGRPIRGQVVTDGTGRFCATNQGIFGPGIEQSIGMPCQVETKSGFVQGRVSKADR